jgi:hypothetical protein
MNLDAVATTLMPGACRWWRVRLALVAVLALASLAGCASPPAPLPVEEPNAGTPKTTTYAWGLSDCEFIIVRAQVPVKTAQALLPPGFAPAPSSLAVGSGGAEFHMDVYDCAGGIDLDGHKRDDVAYASFYVPVIPPDELREDGYGAYFVKLDTLELDDDRREALLEAGFPIHGGQSHVTPDPTGTTWDGFADLRDGTKGTGGFILRGATMAPTEPSGELPFVEYTPLAEGGLARWHARLHDSEIAAGTGTVLVSGFAAEVLGSRNPAEPIPVEFLAGTWNLDEADVTFPIAWP